MVHVGAVDGEALLGTAVADNAAWCDAVCRSLGLVTSRSPGLWTVADPPPLYPHLITLGPQVTAAEVVAALDPRTVSWVKDSFASLQLTEHGFSVVVQASWLYRPLGSVDVDAMFSLVGAADDLADWTSASGTTGTITTRLLADPTVRLVTVHQGGRRTGGAALSLGDEAVGISNVFAAGGSPTAVWEALISAAARLAPERALVGYEAGEDLEAAVRAGFVPIGPLQVWRRPAA